MPVAKQRKEIIALVVLLLAIAAVAVYLLRKPAPPPVSSTYVPPNVSVSIPKSVIEHPEYRKLAAPVRLPLEPGPTGRENPFAPY